MLKKSMRAVISLVLVLTLCISTCSTAFAAGLGGKEYVKEVILSYGKTADEAKKWLTDNDYRVVDHNLNEGADNTFSTARAVYMGYKTTDKADQAITDMKVMNMKGGYSVQDYQMLLDQQKANIQLFFDDFKTAVKEYRANYKAGQARAVAAYEMLNMLYDDDTKQNLGDLLLSKVREEYTDKEYSALSDAEKAKVADMTTILMQGNSHAVLAMEQLIAMATDESETPWANRYHQAKTYDEMVEALADKDDLTVSEAQKQLATEYDQDAKKIANNFESYKEYLRIYTDAGITLESSTEDIEAYQKENEDFRFSEWYAAGTQYETIKALKNDDVSLYDLVAGEAYDAVGADRTLLYPLVSVLSAGQRACLDFLPMYQIVAIGINDDQIVKKAMSSINLDQNEDLQNISVYDGVDRTMFGADVALTGDAYKLQAATGQSAVDTDSPISATSIVLYSVFAVSAVVTGLCWKASSSFLKISADLAQKAEQCAKPTNIAVFAIKEQVKTMENDVKKIADAVLLKSKAYQLQDKQAALIARSNSASGLSKVFTYAGIAMACVTVVLMGISIWSTYQDLKAYYNAEFTPIPSHMVNQAVDADDKKVFTYYTAVKCNRKAQNMVTDSTKLLEDYGDLNGDVGRQWVALYTTKDAAAGDPVTTDFKVQYENTNIPDDHTALSVFCESTVQNLTNKKAGYTYADGKNGIYLFFATDSSALAGSVITNGTYVLVGGISAIVAAAIAFFAGKSAGSKKRKTEKKEEQTSV